jgi:hypothetical protein
VFRRRESSFVFNGHAALYFELKDAEEWGETLNAFFIDWMGGTPLALCILHASDPQQHKFPFPVSLPAPGNTSINIEGMTWRLRTSKIFVVGHSGICVDRWVQGLDGYYFVPGRCD